MQEQYRGEDTNGMGPWSLHPVKYYNKRERRRFLLSVNDGKLHDSDGRPYDTTDGGPRADGHAIFVMDESGRIYSSRYSKVGEFHHSSFLAGEPVAAAGTILVKNGTLHELTDDSGHYKPGKSYTMQAVEHLRSLGVKIAPEIVQTRTE